MKESTLSGPFLKKLENDGWKVFKLSDSFTVGIPDAYTARDRRSVWYEFKALKRRQVPLMVDWSVIIGPKDMVQLINMVELQDVAEAWYILFVISPRLHRTFIEEPRNVLKSVRNHILMELKEYDRQSC
jgi:hypothetical protein